MSSDAKRAANSRYLSKLGSIAVRTNPETTDAIRNAARSAGQPLVAYIVQACFERMARDGYDPQKPEGPTPDEK